MLQNTACAWLLVGLVAAALVQDISDQEQAALDDKFDEVTLPGEFDRNCDTYSNQSYTISNTLSRAAESSSF